MPYKSKNEAVRAFIAAFPVVAGYFTVSFVFGMGCVNLGLPFWFAPLISLLVYAGAGQFSFLVLFAEGASIFTIVFTTFLINLRHMLMSIYLSNLFDKVGLCKKFRWFYGYGLTDESFAFHSVSRQENLTPKFLLSFNISCHISWILGALNGALFINEVKDISSIKLEYALTAMMIYVLVLLANDKRKIIVASVSVITMIGLSFVYESHFNIFFSTFVGCGAGVWLKNKN